MEMLESDFDREIKKLWIVKDNIYMAADYDLGRFLKAQEGDYATALAEIRRGRKTSHWIWYVFPQLDSLGHSHMAKYYGISGAGEARAYLDEPVLGMRLREISEALLAVEGKTAVEILGGIDALKVRSSMTLFDFVSPDDVFARVLEKYYDGGRCQPTLDRVGR